MQKASVGSRPPQTVSGARRLTRADLTVVHGGSRSLPRPFLDLLSFLVFLLGLRKRVVAPEPVGMFDDLPDTGVRHVRIPRGLAKCPPDRQAGPTEPLSYDARLDEIINERMERVEQDRKVRPRALAQFVRFYFDTNESTRAYIMRVLRQRHGREGLAFMDYAELNHRRKLERDGLVKRLNKLIEQSGKPSRENSEIRIVHMPKRGSIRIFYAEVDADTGAILKFLREKDRNRRKAFKTARRHCYRRSHD